MTLKVIGAGFGRTGTMTLKTALEMLGFQRCYHMIEVIQAPSKVAGAWLAAVNGQTPNWEQLFQGFRAAVDWPVVYFLPELIERYPKAKIILTERDANAWYESARRTIFKAIRNVENGWIPKHQELGYEVIVNKTFKGKIDEKDSAIAIYEEHIKWVKAHVPSERLICFDISEGWKGLCEPLGLPIPKKPFPHANTTLEFESRFIASLGNHS